MSWNSNQQFKIIATGTIAPYVGAWVETILYTHNRQEAISLPTWERELKLFLAQALGALTRRSLHGSVSWNRQGISRTICKSCAPSMGAWIETGGSWIFLPVSKYRSLRGSVNWNWIEMRKCAFLKYRSLRGSVSWNFNDQKSTSVRWIAPYVGAWVETDKTNLINQRRAIAPSMGAWIETASQACNWQEIVIAPCMGAWIETQFAQMLYCSNILSLPAWERELKFWQDI